MFKGHSEGGGDGDAHGFGGLRAGGHDLEQQPKVSVPIPALVSS